MHHKKVGSRKWSMSTCLVKGHVTAVGRSAGQEQPKLHPCCFMHFRGLSARNGTVHHCQNLPFEMPLLQAKLACNETRVGVTE